MKGSRPGSHVFLTYLWCEAFYLIFVEIDLLIVPYAINLSYQCRLTKINMEMAEILLSLLPSFRCKFPNTSTSCCVGLSHI